MMHKIEAIIQPFKLEDVKQALVDAGVQGMTVSRVDGFGQQRGQTVVFRGTRFVAQFVTKTKVEVIVPESESDRVVNLIVKAARSGNIGDGKVFVTPVLRAVRVRTGEADDVALQPGEASQTA